MIDPYPMANKIKYTRFRLVAALISVISWAFLVNSTRQDGIDLAESLLRPQVAVQIYTAPLTVESNQTTSSSNYSNNRLSPASKTSRIILKKLRDEEPKSRRNSESARDYQTASSKPMSAWQYETNDVQLQQQPNAQSVELHQLDGNTFALAGPMINAVITVPSLSGPAEVADQRMSASSTIIDSQDEEVAHEHEDQLARNLSATSVERAISHLLDSQASGNLEFNMNMSGDEIIINPVSRRASSLLATSLPAIIGNQENQFLDSGESMIRQYSHNALIDTDGPNQAANRSRVNRRSVARLTKSEQDRDRRWSSSDRQRSSSASSNDEKIPVSTENIDSNEDANSSSDYSGDDEDEDQPNSSATKRTYDEESVFDNELAPAKTKALEVAKKFKTSPGRTVSRSSSDRSDMKEPVRSSLDDETATAVNSLDRSLRAGGKNIDARRSATRDIAISSRRPAPKRRTHQEGRRKLSDDAVQSGAERTPSIYTGNHKALRRSQAPVAAAKSDDSQSPSLVIKGEDLKRFEQLLESLRSLSMVNMGGGKAKPRLQKSSRSEESVHDADDSTKPAAAHRHHKHRDPIPSKRNLRERKTSFEATYDEQNCNKSNRNQSQQPSEDSQQENSPDSSSSNNIERDQGSSSVTEDSTNDNYDQKKRSSSSDDDSNYDMILDATGSQSSASRKNDDGMSLDESDTNLSQHKAAMVKESDGNEQSLPDAHFVRKTILQSYYNRHQFDTGNKPTSNNDPERQPESPDSSPAHADRHQAQFDDKFDEDHRNQEESKSQRLENNIEQNNSKGKQQGSGGTRDTGAYIDYNRLDDREMYRGSESQTFKISVPMEKDGRLSLTGQHAGQTRLSDTKISYLPVLANQLSNGWSAVKTQSANDETMDLWTSS